MNFIQMLEQKNFDVTSLIGLEVVVGSEKGKIQSFDGERFFTISSFNKVWQSGKYAIQLLSEKSQSDIVQDNISQHSGHEHLSQEILRINKSEFQTQYLSLK